MSQKQLQTGETASQIRTSVRGRKVIPTVASRLVLIRLFQQTTSGSVRGCRARHFRRLCANSSRSLLAKKPANSIWPLAAGRMASCVRDAGAGGPMNWRDQDTGNVPPVGAKFR